MKATGYTLVLPPGWRQIALRSGTGEQVAAILADMSAALPPGIPAGLAARQLGALGGWLADAAAAASALPGALDLYLPVLTDYGMPVPASFAVAELAVAGVHPATFVAEVALQDPGTVRAKIVDGAFGYRAERAEGPARDIRIGGEAVTLGFGSRRVDYVLPVPGVAGRWLAVAFTTFGGGDPGDAAARVWTGMFDAIMTTFRWSGDA